MHSDATILALDPGGTKCCALLVRGDGQALGWGIGVGPGLSGRSDKAFLLAARGALAHHVPQSLDIISVRSYAEPTFQQLGIPIRAMTRVGESEAAFALAGESCGLVVLAGTGSFVYGKTRDGRELHLDGIGPVLGDTGSAYFIGLMAMRAAAKSNWHLRFHTTLYERLFAFYGLSDFSDLVAFSLKPKDRSIIAAFARVVDEEASAGDAVARRILTEAADDIAEILHAVIERLEMIRESYTLVGTGGVISHSSIYWNRLCEQARRFAPLLTPMYPSHPAILGVVLAGLRRRQCPDYEQAAATLLATYKNIMAQGDVHGSSPVSG